MKKTFILLVVALVLSMSSSAWGVNTYYQSAGRFSLPPIEVNPRFSDAGIGADYNSTATASGDVGPYSWTFVSGNIPPGLDFVGDMTSKSITLAGKPTKAGKYEFRMTLKTANYERDFTFTIRIYQRDKWLDELERLNNNLENNDNSEASNGNENGGNLGSSGGGGCETGLGIIGLMFLGIASLHKVKH